MSWTQVCNLPFSKYTNNMILDTSEYNNSAFIYGGISTYAGYVKFQHDDSKIIIPVKDSSLNRFTCLRIEAIIKPEYLGRRQNIVEGNRSFAFFIEHDNYLCATINNGIDWVMVKSNKEIDFNRYSTVVFEYDGVCIGKLIVDGKIVGKNINMPIVIKQPEKIIAVGNWPNGDSRYTFKGEMKNFSLYKRDYEDFWADSIANMLCNKKLNDKQLQYINNMISIYNSMDKTIKENIKQCMISRSEKLIEILRQYKAGKIKNIVILKNIVQCMRSTWCSRHDAEITMECIKEYLHVDNPSKLQFIKLVKDIYELEQMYQFNEPEYKDIQSLIYITFPELKDIDKIVYDFLEIHNI